MPNPPIHRRRPVLRLGAVALGGAALAGIGALLLGFLGQRGLALQSPPAGAVVGLGGLEVLVRFAEGAGVEPATLRVLLNGADVSPGVATGSNGAVGRLHGLLEGENRLRVEVFRRSPYWPGLWVEEAREVRILYRPRLDLDRA